MYLKSTLKSKGFQTKQLEEEDTCFQGHQVPSAGGGTASPKTCGPRPAKKYSCHSS